MLKAKLAPSRSIAGSNPLTPPAEVRSRQHRILTNSDLCDDPSLAQVINASRPPELDAIATGVSSAGHAGSAISLNLGGFEFSSQGRKVLGLYGPKGRIGRGSPSSFASLRLTRSRIQAPPVGSGASRHARKP